MPPATRLRVETTKPSAHTCSRNISEVYTPVTGPRTDRNVSKLRAGDRRAARADSVQQALTVRADRDVLCGSCGLTGISHQAHETNMSSTIEQADSRKPAGLISGKRCGRAAVHNPPRLQADVQTWVVLFDRAHLDGSTEFLCSG
jgi:hypothetical protein